MAGGRADHGRRIPFTGESVDHRNAFRGIGLSDFSRGLPGDPITCRVAVKGFDDEGVKRLCRSFEDRRPVDFGEGRNNLEKSFGRADDPRIEVALGHGHIHRHLFQRTDV